MTITNEQISEHLSKFDTSIEEIDLNLNPDPPKLTLATILYSLVKETEYESLLILETEGEDKLKNAFHKIFNELLTKVTLGKQKKMHFSLSNGNFKDPTKRYSKEYIATLFEIKRNLQLKTIFLEILFCKEPNWVEIAIDINSIKPHYKKKDCEQNRLFSWMSQKINHYMATINALNITEKHTALVHVVVAFKIYLERVHHQVKRIPMERDEVKLEELPANLIKLIKEKPHNLTIQELNGNDENAFKQLDSIYPKMRDIRGREFITYFMEELQINTIKCHQYTYQNELTTPLLIISITKSLRKFSEMYKTFSDRIYRNTVPYTSFRPIFIKNLISTLQKKRDIDSVFDPCGGWGGTIVGASISKVKLIVDNDVNPALKEPKSKLVDFLKSNMSSEERPDYHLLEQDISDFPANSLHDRKVALICTSPPFFNYEEYDTHNESGKQSRTDKTCQQWMDNFVPKYIENSVFHLQEGGFFALQISNMNCLENFVARVLKKVIDSNLFNAAYSAIPYSSSPKYKKTDNDLSKNNINYFFVFEKKQSLPKIIRLDDNSSPETGFKRGATIEDSIDCPSADESQGQTKNKGDFMLFNSSVKKPRIETDIMYPSAIHR